MEYHKKSIPENILKFLHRKEKYNIVEKKYYNLTLGELFNNKFSLKTKIAIYDNLNVNFTEQDDCKIIFNSNSYFLYGLLHIYDIIKNYPNLYEVKMPNLIDERQWDLFCKAATLLHKTKNKHMIYHEFILILSCMFDCFKHNKYNQIFDIFENIYYLIIDNSNNYTYVLFNVMQNKNSDYYKIMLEFKKENN